MSKRPVNAVIAIANGGAIGLRGDLPWPRIREDMAHFRAVTMTHAVVMGRATWEGLPAKHRPLQGRMNIVVSRTMPLDALAGVGFVVRSVEEGLELARAKDRSPHVIGGAQIYVAAEPLIDRWYITRIAREVEADTRFEPELDPFVLRDVEELAPGLIAETWRRS